MPSILRRLKEEIAALKSDNAKLQAKTEDLKYRTEFKDTLSSLWQHQAEYWKTQAESRDDTIKALQVALSLGLDTRLVLETPLMWLNKAQTWHMAKDLGGSELVALIEEDTHTCYLGDRTQRHAWGYGCNTCPACDLRRAGHELFQAA